MNQRKKEDSNKIKDEKGILQQIPPIFRGSSWTILKTYIPKLEELEERDKFLDTHNLKN
jgi:hypothetical protein